MTPPFHDDEFGVWSASPGWNDGTFHSFGMVYDTVVPRFTVRVDGLVTTSGPVPRAGGGGGTWIGGYPIFPVETQPFMEGPLQGYIAEVIVACEPTDEQIAKLSAYFQGKYGVPF